MNRLDAKGSPDNGANRAGLKVDVSMKTLTSLRVARKPNSRPSLVHPKLDSTALRLRWLMRNTRLSETHAGLVAELAFRNGRTA
jgi:hypothetical protein